jgi:hypothetical protein
MNDIKFPTQPTSTIIKASVIATIVAILVYLTVILPAEYNIDPTGIGKKLGLVVLSEEGLAEASEQTDSVNQSAIAEQSDTVTIKVPPYRGVEYKFYLKQYAKLTYEWVSDGAPLYFDFHGEPEGDDTGYFESYTITTAASVSGSMTMPFAGSHGWYWKNKSDKAVEITLTTSGNYEVIGLK